MCAVMFDHMKMRVAGHRKVVLADVLFEACNLQGVSGASERSLPRRRRHGRAGYLLPDVCARISGNRNVLHRTGRVIETVLNGQRRQAGPVLHPVQPLFFYCADNSPIAEESG